MSTEIRPQLLTFKNWTFRLLRVQPKPMRLLLLIHGWMGDENSMWVFTQRLSQNFTILAPRGPFQAAGGGFSWREIRPGTWGNSTLNDLEPSAEALLAFLDEFSSQESMDVSQMDLMGFSQGAAMVYILTLLHPERIRRMVALSGFIPLGGEVLITENQFRRIPIFISHGRQDELIPVDAARQAVKLFKQAGANVTYCESDTGHKISRECLKEIEKFLV